MRQSYFRKGNVLINATALLVGLFGVVSLAVDFGRVTVAKAQLSHAAEAAARAGAASLDGGSAAAFSAASVVAALNRCDGSAVQLMGSEVSVGTWNTAARTFTEISPLLIPTAANAVCVKPRRTAQSGGPIPLEFASLIGMSGCNVQAEAIAKLTRGLPSQGLIGLDEVRFSSIGVLAEIRGNVASNGDIYIGHPLGLLVGVDGDVQSYAGLVRKGTLAGITGSKQPLDAPLDCPPVDVPSDSDNSQIASYLDSDGDFNALVNAYIPAGTYVVRDLNLVAGLKVRLEGPVKFIVTRNVNIAASVNLLGNPSFDPSNFKVRVASGGHVFFLGNLLTPTCMDLYAPTADIDIAVTINNFRGRIVGKTVQIEVPALSRFDVRDPPIEPSFVTLVK